MIFKPEKSKLWDTFILPYNDRYYLFYLQCREDYWDGYGLAISDDLLHWQDFGTILDLGHASGTGMVYRADDQWVLSYCRIGVEGQKSHICFAVSQDLFHWDKLPEGNNLYPDEQWYDAAFPGRTSSRFGDLWVERQADGSFYGFLTASKINGPAGANGVIGMASSTDGLSWKALEPASNPCGMGWLEFGSHVEINGRHYALVGSSSGLGRRFDSVYNSTGKAGGMYVMMANQIEGPYEFATGDNMILGCRNAPPNWAYVPTYYTRTLKLNNQILLHHHWMPRNNFTDAWLGTCKVLREDWPGKLSLNWWPGNEALKGNKIFDIVNRPCFTQPKSSELPTGGWCYCDKRLELETDSSVLIYSDTRSFKKGIVVETCLRINGDGAGGLFFGSASLDADHPYEGMAFLCNTRGLAEFGAVTFGICSPAFMVENHVLWPVTQGKDVRIRLLVKEEFIEAYIDDRLVQCYGFSKPVDRYIGLFAENCRIEVDLLNIYEFSI